MKRTLLIITVVSGLAAGTAQSALAFNPQPEPPGTTPRVIDNPDLRKSTSIGSRSILTRLNARMVHEVDT